MRDRIVRIILRAGKRGILQEELTHRYGISKSTVSTTLSKLEREKLVCRKRVAGKSYRVWHIKHSPFPADGIIRVGILRAIEYPSIFLVANDLENPKVLIKIYRNAFELTKDLAEGYIDAGCSPLITQSLFALVYGSIRIRAGCGFRGGGIVKRVQNPKSFGSSELSTMEFMLKKYMEKMKSDSQIRYFTTPDAMISALDTGEVDAIAIWEPYLTQLSEKYEVIRFESLFGNYPCCTLAFNSKVENREENRKFLKTYRKAVDELQERKEEAISLESRALKIKKDEIKKAFDGYRYNWKLEESEARRVLEDFGIKLTDESAKRIFNLL